MFSQHRNTDNNVFFSQPSSVKHGLDTSGHNTCWWVSLSLILLFKTNVFTTRWFVAETSNMILLKVGSLMPLVLCPAAVGDPSRSFLLATCCPPLPSRPYWRVWMRFCSRKGPFEHSTAVQPSSRGSKRQVKTVESEGWAALRAITPHPWSPLSQELYCADLI